MRSRLILVTIVLAIVGTMVLAQGNSRHLNPMVDLLKEKKAVFGISPPSVPNPNAGQAVNRGGEEGSSQNILIPDACGISPEPRPARGEGGPAARGGEGRGRGGEGRGAGGGAAARGGAPASNVPQPKDLNEAAKFALSYKAADYLYNGSMENGVDRNIGAFTNFVNALKDSGPVTKTPYSHLTHPLIVKTPSIAPDKNYVEDLSKQLNLGVSGLMFVDVDCAKEVQMGLGAMRFKSKGGTRPDAVGIAPALWGMSEKEYKDKADLWPLNPDGELVNWTIIESKEGLKNRRAIGAVKGIGVLWPGAGTLRGIFSTVQPDGTVKRDDAAWEEAIQQVLAVCKEFNLACGYPVSTPADVEMRLKQGFTVFVAQSWSQGSFDTIAAGRKAAGRPAAN